MAAALLLLELGLRPFSTPLDNGWAPITAETIDSGTSKTVRRFTEGIAASNFTPARQRLTGNSVIEEASNGLILGDSYVEAVQVSDRSTMGSVLERLLRATGEHVNVRQYGWPGVDVPQYVLVAHDLMRLWDPDWVVVVLTANDLGPDLLTGGTRLVQGADGSWGVVGSFVPRRTGQAHRLAEALLSRSVLLYHLSKRAQEAGLPLSGGGQQRGGPASTKPGGLPLQDRARIALSALRDAYGKRLRILFVADVGIDGRSQQSPAEESIMAACASLGVRCANTRPLMTQDRIDSLRLARGFINSTPGAGHINALGHTIAAKTMLELVSP